VADTKLVFGSYIYSTSWSCCILNYLLHLSKEVLCFGPKGLCVAGHRLPQWIFPAETVCESLVVLLEGGQSQSSESLNCTWCTSSPPIIQPCQVVITHPFNKWRNWGSENDDPYPGLWLVRTGSKGCLCSQLAATIWVLPGPQESWLLQGFAIPLLWLWAKEPCLTHLCNKGFERFEISEGFHLRGYPLCLAGWGFRARSHMVHAKGDRGLFHSVSPCCKARLCF
jgi:hypothetical protein